MLQILVCYLLFYTVLAQSSSEESINVSNEDGIQDNSLFNENSTDFEKRRPIYDSNEDNIQNISLSKINTKDFDERSLRFAPIPIRDRVYAMGVFRKVNWFQAEQFCAAQGMTLASINSAQQGEQIRRLVYESGLVTDKSEFWTSGTDLSENRNFYWFGNGRPFIYENWAKGEPNNCFGKEHCVMVDAFGKWADADCSLNKLFICENRCSVDSYNIFA